MTTEIVSLLKQSVNLYETADALSILGECHEVQLVKPEEKLAFEAVAGRLASMAVTIIFDDKNKIEKDSTSE